MGARLDTSQSTYFNFAQRGDKLFRDTSPFATMRIHAEMNHLLRLKAVSLKNLDSLRHLVVVRGLFDDDHHALEKGRTFDIKGRGTLRIHRDSQNDSIVFTLKKPHETRTYRVQLKCGSTENRRMVDSLIRDAAKIELEALEESP